MRAWMDDEQPVVQQLQILRCLRFVEFIGQGLIKEVQPPDSPEVGSGDPNPVSREFAQLLVGRAVPNTYLGVRFESVGARHTCTGGPYGADGNRAFPEIALEICS